MSDWSMLTNHALVLVCIAREPGCRLREIAQRVGLTERATYRLVNDLAQAGYLIRHRLGNRSFYEIRAEQLLRHEVEGQVALGDLLRPFVRQPADT